MFCKKEAAGSKGSGWWSGESNPQDESNLEGNKGREIEISKAVFKDKEAGIKSSSKR